jgi:hypothetical protein
MCSLSGTTTLTSHVASLLATLSTNEKRTLKMNEKPSEPWLFKLWYAYQYWNVNHCLLVGGLNKKVKI